MRQPALERLMDMICEAFHGKPTLCTDDIIVIVRNLHNLEGVLMTIHEARLKLSKKNYSLFIFESHRKVKYLGHMVSADDVSVDKLSEKLQTSRITYDIGWFGGFAHITKPAFF